MKVFLYSNDLIEQDVVDKLFFFVKDFLSNEKVVLWLRRKEFNVAPTEKAIGDFDVNKLSYLLLSYCERKIRVELAEMLSDLWFESDKSLEDEEQIHKSFDIFFVEMKAVSPKFIDGVFPILIQIENELKKLNQETQVMAALPEKCFDENLIIGFENVWKIEFCKL